MDPCLKDPSHLAVIEGSPYTNISRIIRYPELEDEGKADIALNPLQWHPSAAAPLSLTGAASPADLDAVRELAATVAVGL